MQRSCAHRKPSFQSIPCGFADVKSSSTVSSSAGLISVSHMQSIWLLSFGNRVTSLHPWRMSTACMPFRQDCDIQLGLYKPCLKKKLSELAELASWLTIEGGDLNAFIVSIDVSIRTCHIALLLVKFWRSWVLAWTKWSQWTSGAVAGSI